ncbi:hypothetical protein IEQ_04790 [Bacillus cereus BAG6X1-2]|nr:hypothetical protein IEQ_04790 [Bacillus cereus BAG6X1-2]
MELWESIPDYKDSYEISNYGRVRAKERRGIDGRFLKGKILKGGSFSNGYLFVCLRKNGKSKNHLIHRLVAEVFVENISELPVVNHKDGVKTNNHFSNLEWCTQSQNLKHAVEIGMIANQCKITREVVIKRAGTTIIFESMKGCASFFGYKKGWLHNKIRKYGNKFEFLGYQISVKERSDVENGTAIL